MNITDPITDQGRTAAADHFLIDEGETIADLLSQLIEGQVQAQLDELCDDQWGILSLAGALDEGGAEDTIRMHADRLHQLIHNGMQDAIAEWRTRLTLPDPVTVYGPSEDDDDPLHYTVSGDLRTSENTDGNHAYTDEIKRRFGVLFATGAIPQDVKVEFDSEHSCFFAYAGTEQVANLIAQIARDAYTTWDPPA